MAPAWNKQSRNNSRPQASQPSVQGQSALNVLQSFTAQQKVAQLLPLVHQLQTQRRNALLLNTLQRLQGLTAQGQRLHYGTNPITGLPTQGYCVPATPQGLQYLRFNGAHTQSHLQNLIRAAPQINGPLQAQQLVPIPTFPASGQNCFVPGVKQGFQAYRPPQASGKQPQEPVLPPNTTAAPQCLYSSSSQLQSQSVPTSEKVPKTPVVSSQTQAHASSLHPGAKWTAESSQPYQMEIGTCTGLEMKDPTVVSPPQAATDHPKSHPPGYGVRGKPVSEQCRVSKSIATPVSQPPSDPPTKLRSTFSTEKAKQGSNHWDNSATVGQFVRERQRELTMVNPKVLPTDPDERKSCLENLMLGFKQEELSSLLQNTKVDDKVNNNAQDRKDRKVLTMNVNAPPFQPSAQLTASLGPRVGPGDGATKESDNWTTEKSSRYEGANVIKDYTSPPESDGWSIGERIVEELLASADEDEKGPPPAAVKVGPIRKQFDAQAYGFFSGMEMESMACLESDTEPDDIRCNEVEEDTGDTGNDICESQDKRDGKYLFSLSRIDIPEINRDTEVESTVKDALTGLKMINPEDHSISKTLKLEDRTGGGENVANEDIEPIDLGRGYTLVELQDICMVFTKQSPRKLGSSLGQSSNVNNQNPGNVAGFHDSLKGYWGEEKSNRSERQSKGHKDGSEKAPILRLGSKIVNWNQPSAQKIMSMSLKEVTHCTKDLNLEQDTSARAISEYSAHQGFHKEDGGERKYPINHIETYPMGKPHGKEKMSKGFQSAAAVTAETAKACF